MPSIHDRPAVTTTAPMRPVAFALALLVACGGPSVSDDAAVDAGEASDARTPDAPPPGDAAVGLDMGLPSDAGTDARADTLAVCGNAILEADEECDDGNSADGDGCEIDCTFTCVTDAGCDDLAVCNGTERCDLESHRCLPGDPADGIACPDGVCRSGVCLPALCGDGAVTAPEECDDGNAVSGDGCEADCTFSCHAPEDCDDGNPCTGTESCVAGRCEAGAPLDEGAACDADGDPATRDVCRGMVCRRSLCGDGVLDPEVEACDDGNLRDGDGCERDCTPTCSTGADCDDGDPCNGIEACVDGACLPGAPASDGAMCGMDRVCEMACCRPSVCGDGLVDPDAGEVCDDGNDFGGDGCENDCTATCAADLDCDDGEPCNGAETCDMGRCAAGAPPSPGAACGAGRLCVDQACREPRCGDGVVSAGEACDDGNATGGDGCESDCAPSCASDGDCDDGEACNGSETCDAGACVPGVFEADGTSCGVLASCRGGRCAASGCGDGSAGVLEACDDGNLTDGDGCDNDCTLSCADAADCDDGNPCNGAEACTANRCVPGAPAADGTDCGGGSRCVASACRAPACGDGFVDAGEDCDDGNGTAGDGCEADCTLSCARDADCSDGDACSGTERCVAGACASGTPRPDGASCAGGGVCRMGACRDAACGDGVVSAGELCDDGNDVPGDGCECDCTPSCVADRDCDDGEPCNGVERCDGAVCVAGTPEDDGTTCDVDGDPSSAEFCFAGLCGRSNCGDGRVDAVAGEECDDGNAVRGDGCEPDCSFSCVRDENCDDGRACNGVERCDLARHACAEGIALDDGTLCERDGMAETRDHCLRGACRRSTCGDGYLDPEAGETCEPPTPDCDPATCTIVVTTSVCGDGRAEDLEQCDDGGTDPWDRCDGRCRLEQTLRASRMELLGPGQGCDLDGDGAPDNAFGNALGAFVRDLVNDGLADAIVAGELNLLAAALDLDDRLGRNDASVEVALFSGMDAEAPFEGARGEAFTLPDGAVEGDRPVNSLPGEIIATALRSGPGVLTPPSEAGGFGGAFALHEARIDGTLVADTGRRRVDRMIDGLFCGAIQASDLDRSPAPEMVPASCRSADTSLLDLLVLGCNLGTTPLLVPTQPDIDVDHDGIGSGMLLSDTDGDRVIDRCVLEDGTVLLGDDCAQDPRFDEAYSQAIAIEAYWVLLAGLHTP